MKRRLRLQGVLGAVSVALIIGGAAQQAYGTGAGLAAFVLALALPFLNKRRDAAYGLGAGVTREIWEDHIEGNLYKDNEFLLNTTDSGQYVLNGTVVHIPQAGDAPDVVKNRSSLPATISGRTDNEVTYLLDAYTTDPILLPNAERMELSYDKRESVLADHQSAMRERIAEELLYTWAPDALGAMIRTTGDDDVPAHLPSATGNRKAFTTKDLKAAQLLMNKQNIPARDRYCLMSADMYDQFTESLTETQYRDFSTAIDPATGIVGMLFGFKIMQRSTVIRYTNAATPVRKAFDAVGAATDNDAVLCWQKAAIERAVGNVKFFERVDDPTFYGDIYSIEVRMGGRKRRTDSKGIIAIVQAEGEE